MTVAKLYGPATRTLVNKEWDWDTDTISVALCTSSYTPAQDTHDYANDLTNELSGGGYARVTATDKTVNYDADTNTLTLDCGDVDFAGLTAADIRYAVFLADTGTDDVSPLICYWDFEANLSAADQLFQLQIATAGLVTITVA